MNKSGSIFALSIVPLFLVGMESSVNAQQTTPPAEEPFEKPDVGVLQKQIDDLKAKVDRLENDPGQGDTVGPAPAKEDQDQNFKIDWTPGPRISTPDGRFRFQLNGRMTYDYSNVTFKDGDGTARPADKINGINNRHLEFGVRGRFFGSFNYRIVTKFVDNEVDIKMAYVDYRIDNTRVIVGQTRTFNTLDQMTPPPNTAFAERAAFINALRIKRRVGVGVSQNGENWSVSGGYFFDNISNGNSAIDDNNMYSGRATFSPRLENGVGLHFGVSGFYRNRNGRSFDHDYSVRPFAKQGSLKPLASEEFNISSETFYNGEFVFTYGSFAAQAEYGIMKNKLSPLETLISTNPSYNGGYVEVSFFPTGGERTINGTNGRFNNVEIENPVGDGGMGEVRLAARYDMADFTHETFGRKQKSLILAADWYLNDVLKIQGNFAHTIVKDAANVKTDIVDTFNLRLMLNF